MLFAALSSISAKALIGAFAAGYTLVRSSSRD